MIAKEKINRRIALKRVKNNINELKNSSQTIKSIYKVIFKNHDYTYLNVLNTYGYDEYTYDEVDYLNYSYAKYFKDNISSDTQYVGILLDNCKEWIFTFFGLIIAGFVPVLLSTANDYKEIEYVKEKINLSYIITNKPINFDWPKIISPFEIKSSDVNREVFNNWADEIVFLTSGSTGNPKIVFYEGKQVCSQIYNAGLIYQENKAIGRAYKGYLKHLVILPFYHIFGLFAVLLWFSFFNVTFVLPIDLNPKSIKQACLLTKPSHVFAVPLFWQTVNTQIKLKLDTEEKKKKLNKALKLSYKLQKHFGYLGTSIVRDIFFKKYLNLIFGTSIRFSISGGAFLDEETLRTINLLGYPLVNGYGATEIGITSLCPCDKLTGRLSTSIGIPFETIDYNIENNELYVHALSTSKHYIDSVGEHYIDEDSYINTHDCVKKDKNLYCLFGRNDEIIVDKNGENISLPLIENGINLTVAKEYAVVLHNGNIALVACFDKFTKIEFAIKEFENIPSKYLKYISEIYYTNKDLPKANSLKIKRHELSKDLDVYSEHYTNIKEIKNDSSIPVEKINDDLLSNVLLAFKKVFPEQNINENSHFYNDLGGNSLKYVVLLNELESLLHLQVDVDYSTTIPYTPKEFVEEIKRRKGI